MVGPVSDQGVGFYKFYHFKTHNLENQGGSDPRSRPLWIRACSSCRFNMLGLGPKAKGQ